MKAECFNYRLLSPNRNLEMMNMCQLSLMSIQFFYKAEMDLICLFQCVFIIQCLHRHDIKEVLQFYESSRCCFNRNTLVQTGISHLLF